jgi:hypothetical protein
MKGLPKGRPFLVLTSLKRNTIFQWINHAYGNVTLKWHVFII